MPAILRCAADCSDAHVSKNLESEALFTIMLLYRKNSSISLAVMVPVPSVSNTRNILRSWWPPPPPFCATLSRIIVSSGIGLPATLMFGSRRMRVYGCFTDPASDLPLGSSGSSGSSGTGAGRAGVGALAMASAVATAASAIALASSAGSTPGRKHPGPIFAGKPSTSTTAAANTAPACFFATLCMRDSAPLLKPFPIAHHQHT
jgi:hypothetical protein